MGVAFCIDMIRTQCITDTLGYTVLVHCICMLQFGQPKEEIEGTKDPFPVTLVTMVCTCMTHPHSFQMEHS